MLAVIHPAQPKDTPALVQSITRTCAHYAARIPDLPDVAGGLADAIAKHLVWVAERAITRLILRPHAQMPENLSLYAHLGWRETGRSGNTIQMEKILPV